MTGPHKFRAGDRFVSCDSEIDLLGNRDGERRERRGVITKPGQWVCFGVVDGSSVETMHATHMLRYLGVRVNPERVLRKINPPKKAEWGLARGEFVSIRVIRDAFGVPASVWHGEYRFGVDVGEEEET